MGVEQRTYTVLPECKVKLDSMEKDITEIHDIVYKDGLVTKLALVKDKVEKMSSSLEKMVWLLVGLVVAFLADLIGGLLLP